MENFIKSNTPGDTITSEMKNFISREGAKYMYYINSQTLYELGKIALNIADTDLTPIDAQAIISQMKSILCSSLSSEIIKDAQVKYKELLAINNSSNSKAIDVIYSKVKVNCDGTINANSITIEDLQLLNNIVENNNSSLIRTNAKDLLEVIKIYKIF
ncbi:hypothetical protein [Clostridium botulinum]|uniref:hypothetical protein n=1 Tax=Clostridium botulinum TaxID=1491 RepID=UPI0005F95E46|nr:hypothetical protein [Clostridium botulinum]APU59606.1 hypothetical protein NPD8_1565 [Clostridium botulinum]NFM29860.1 hypothetical protein [Clostridium botulinum]